MKGYALVFVASVFALFSQKADATGGSCPVPGGTSGVRNTSQLRASYLQNKHGVLLHASALAYLVPELYKKRPGAELLESFKAFMKAVPPGYRPEFTTPVVDPVTSFKGVVLSPTGNFCEKPVIIALAGTQDKDDVAADLTFGAVQCLSPAYHMLLNSVLSLSRKHPECAHLKVQLTGHSLGGAMAQFLAYDLARQTHPNGITSQGTKLPQIELVTWNAPGVLKIASQYGQVFKPKGVVSGAPDLGMISTTNYFFNREPISRFGPHWGRTVRISEDDSKLVRGASQSWLGSVTSAILPWVGFTGEAKAQVAQAKTLLTLHQVTTLTAALDGQRARFSEESPDALPRAIALLEEAVSASGIGEAMSMAMVLKNKLVMAARPFQERVSSVKTWALTEAPKTALNAEFISFVNAQISSYSVN